MEQTSTVGRDYSAELDELSARLDQLRDQLLQTNVIATVEGREVSL